jgi:catechol 2,3-dioxygenase-like lactoylglutathione lyase family enzyme
MTIEGISHITLIVQDLKRTSTFLSSILEAKEVYDSGEETFSLSKERFLLLAGVWVVLMEGGPLSDPTYNHIAFKIPESKYENYRDRLEKTGVDFHEGRPRIPGEGLSLYFYDYDNHLFELHTGTLEERLETYRNKKGQPTNHSSGAPTAAPA